MDTPTLKPVIAPDKLRGQNQYRFGKGAAHADPQPTCSRPLPKDQGLQRKSARPELGRGLGHPGSPNWAAHHFASMSSEESCDEEVFFPCVSTVRQSTMQEDKAPWMKYNLSVEEYNQFVSIFLTFDEGLGILNKPKFEKLCLFLNYAHTSRDSDYLFEEVDTNKTGAISLHDFCLWFSANSPGTKESYGLERFQYNRLVLQFRGCDTFNRGLISMRQFRHLCLITRMTTSKFQEDYLVQLLRRNGCRTEVSLRDFLALYRDIQEKKNRKENFFPSPSSIPLFATVPVAQKTTASAPVNQRAIPANEKPQSGKNYTATAPISKEEKKRKKKKKKHCLIQ